MTVLSGESGSVCNIGTLYEALFCLLVPWHKYESNFCIMQKLAFVFSVSTLQSCKSPSPLVYKPINQSITLKGKGGKLHLALHAK